MTTLVGRDAELAILAAAVGDEGTSVLLLSGAPGTGKTALLAELEGMLECRPLFRVQGHAPESAVPLLAASGMLRALARTDDGLSEVLRADPARPPVEVFEAVNRAVAVTAGQPAVLVDDEQWVDSTTQALLHFLARGAAQDGRALLLAFASRPSARAATMHESLHALLGDAVRRVVVEPLTREAGVLLATSIDPSLSAARAGQVWQRAGGSPFWISALARWGESEVGTVIQERLASCTDPAEQVLALLATAGRPLELESVLRGTGLGRPMVSEAVHELVESGLARSASGSVATAHDLVAERVIAELGPQRLRQVHGRLAAVLGESSDPVALLAAVGHRAAGGEPVDELLQRIVESPDRARLGHDGVAALVERTRNADLPERLLAEIAALAADVGRKDLALPLWSRLATVGTPSRTAAAVDAAAAEYEAGNPVQSRRWLSVAASCGAMEPSLEARAAALESHLLRWMDADFGAAAHRAQAALALARAAPASAGRDSRAALVDAVVACATDAMVRGDVGAVDDYAQQLMEIATDDPDLAHTAVSFRLVALGLAGEPRLAAAVAWPRWQIALESGRLHHAIEAGCQLLDSLVEQARIDDARDIARELEQLLDRLREPSHRLPWGITASSVAGLLLELDVLTGDWRRALERQLAAAEEMHPHNQQSELVLVAEHLSRLSPGADPQVEALVARALSLAASVGCSRCAEEVDLRAARIRARCGTPGKAASVVAAWRRDEAPPPIHQLAAWTRALVDGQAGRLSQALQRFDQLDDALAASGRELDRWWLLLDRALLLRETAPEQAVVHLDALAAAAHTAGAVNVEAVAHRHLRALGARPWRRTAGAGAQLSDRERMVAELLATGATNPEIAQRLFLSRKTVERHVSSILAKLGARNRAEVAARWERADQQGEGLPR